MEFRDLKKQYEYLKADIDKAIADVVNSAHFISGPQVSELEKQLAEYVGVKHCITCANGTDALVLAAKTMEIGPGDAVFVPDFTFFATAEAAAIQGATPIFVDVCENTFNMDPQKLDSAIQDVIAQGELNAKAIIAVDLFGLPADYISIRQIADKYGLLIIEDGAQGFGGEIDGRKACSFGDISTTSFFPAKPLGCYGDGGAIFTNNDEWAALIRSYVVHGKGVDKYDNVRIGTNSRLDTIQAAILKVKFKAFVENEVAAINKVASWYDEMLPSTLAKPKIPENYYSSWAQYTLRLDSAEQRAEIQKKLKAHNIPSMIYYRTAMHAEGAFSELPYTGSCPVTEKLCETVLSLPIHPYMEKEDVAFVCEKLKEIV